MWQWWNGIISGEIPLHVNSSEAFLIEKSLQHRSGQLSADGALVVSSGKKTDLSPEDKYIVKDEITENIIDWHGRVSALTEEVFEQLKTDILKKIHLLKPELFIEERSIGADASYALGVNLITTSPVHALFSKMLLRKKLDKYPLGHFTIYLDPDFEVDQKKIGPRSQSVIAVNFKKCEIIISGTGYCGEIKEALFSVMNAILPDHGVLPIRGEASSDAKGNVSVYFGDSGTGKTFLSRELGMNLIGTDELGISERGIFNFEGGTYTKTRSLIDSSEEEIAHATNRFGSLIENIHLDQESRRPVFEDLSTIQTGHTSYPLSALQGIINDGRGEVPAHLFFFSSDHLGVLPLISRLDPGEAMFFFLLGYSAQEERGEVRVKEMNPTFTHCFSSPPMMRPPWDYGNLLKEMLKNHPTKVWMINSGWFGGPHGIGKKYDPSLIRSCIRAVQSGYDEQSAFLRDPVFSLSIPETLEGVDAHYLKPHLLWANHQDYFAAAGRLKAMLREKFQELMKE